MKNNIYEAMLNYADAYAKTNSTCTKTAVGCCVFNENNGEYHFLSLGANRGEVNCKEVGCLRIVMFGDNSKEHRSTCRCHHSEIDAIQNAKEPLVGATACVTRYPCDDCAIALVKAGIKRVVYGREFEISESAKKLFQENKIEVIHIPEWNCDLNDKNN